MTETEKYRGYEKEQANLAAAKAKHAYFRGLRAFYENPPKRFNPVADGKTQGYEFPR